MKKEKVSGIYTITYIINNKIYVGESINIYKRWVKHIEKLRVNKHGNIHLQRAWNKYKEENFIFDILEECQEEYLSSQENYWANMLNVHNIDYGYNIQLTYPDNKRVGYKPTKETRDKIGNSHRGKTVSSETRKLVSDKAIEFWKYNKEKMKEIIKNSPKITKEFYKEREKLVSKALLGTTQSDVTKKKRSNKLINKPWSEKRRLAQKNRNGNKNKD